MKSKVNILIALGLVFVLFGLLFTYYGYDDTWRLWSIRPMDLPFGDTRAILAPVESYKQGFDPMVQNPSDPWRRKLNVPRIWLGIHLLGIDQGYTLHLGIIFVMLFVVGIYLYLPPLSNVQVGLLFSAILSPAVLLCIERGNVDLVMFSLVAIAVVCINRHPVWATVSLLLGLVLKLYPVFGLTVLLRRSKSTVISLATVSFGFAVILTIYTFSDLALIRRNTPLSTAMSYGIDVMWLIVTRNYDPSVKLFGRILSYVTGLAILLYALSALAKDSAVSVDDDGRSLDAFRAGSAVYIGTFLLGSNFDYRLIFLLFTIPQLWRWISHPEAAAARISKLTLLAVYASLWHLVLEQLIENVPYSRYMSVMLEQSFKWIVFGGLAYLLCFSMPQWFRQWDRERRVRGRCETSISAT